MRAIVLCVNARLLETSVSRQIEEVRGVFLNTGCRVELVRTVPFEHGPSLTRQMLAAVSPDAVIVCGGDGTVFDALQSVAGTSVALGVVPFGTGNILAQNLGIQGPAASIAAALLKAETRSVRLGAVTLSGANAATHYFVSAAGVGPHATVLKLASQRTKQVAGKAAYWAAGIQTWLKSAPRTFEAAVTNGAGVSRTWRVSEAIALRVRGLNLWRPGGALNGESLRLAMVPETGRIGFVSAISRAILARDPATAASDAELDDLLRRNRAVGRSGTARWSVFYQDVERVVFRPLAADEPNGCSGVQADGEVLNSCTTTIEISDKSVHLLFPLFS